MSHTKKNSVSKEYAEDLGEKTINNSFKSPWVKLEICFYVVVLTYLAGTGGIALIEEFNKHLTGKTPLKLKEGWIGGRRFDESDMQWAQFRDHVMIVAIVGAVLILGSRAVRFFSKGSVGALSLWNFFVGFAFVGYTSELRVLWPLLWTTLNYFVLKFLNNRKITPIATWALNCFLIYFFEISHSRFSYFHHSLEWMDEYSGFFPWNGIPYMIVLRCISFNMDYYWMLTKPPVLKHDLSYRSRQEVHGSSSDYNYLVFLGYMFYQPTWICGPTVTYNAYVSQLKVPQQTHDTVDLILYTLRTVFAYTVKDYMDHYIYINAYLKYIFATGEYKNLNVFFLGVCAYFGLKSVYLKFLCIWRLWRNVALLDGIEVPENMNKCMSNNYSVSGFWRSWHRSFNQWLIRYIYIPIGGSRAGVVRQILNVFLTFAFVIFAHAPTVASDPQIFAWGLSMALFMVPEIIGGLLFNTPQLSWIKGHWVWRWLVASGGSFTIVVLMAANLCGYGIALSGAKPVAAVRDLLLYIFTNSQFGIVTFLVMFAATNVLLVLKGMETVKDS